MSIQLFDAFCRVEQAKELLDVWLETVPDENRTANMISTLMTILDGVSESINEADDKLCQVLRKEFFEGEK